MLPLCLGESAAIEWLCDTAVNAFCDTFCVLLCLFLCRVVFAVCFVTSFVSGVLWCIQSLLQIPLCDEMAKMFYNEPHYVWDDKTYHSEYELLAKISGFGIGDTSNVRPILSANNWRAIYDMCKLSR